MINESTIQNIRASARIDEVVGDFVTLKKSGSGFVACCPFHNEKTPSFSVSPSKNLFKCFGCGAGGDAISFMIKQGKSYPDAIKYLAAKYKIAVEETANGKPDPKLDEKTAARTTAAALQAHFCVTAGTKETPAIKYWRDRSFTIETIDEFGVGYCDGSKPEHMGAELSAIGAVNKDGNLIYYKRTTIPIHDRTGNVIAWGARALSDLKEQAKYINSPESVIYQKQNTLFNLHRAAPYIRQRGEIWIVEGYADCMALWQMGTRNVVALCGTTLSEGQMNEIKKFNGDKSLTIILALDNEITAGTDRHKTQVETAWYAALEKLVEVGEVRTVIYPKQAKDMADVLRIGLTGAQLEKKDAIKFMAETTCTEDWLKGASPVEKADFQDKTARMLARVKRDNVRTVYITDLCTTLGISAREFDKIVKGHRTEHETEEKNRVAQEFRFIKVADDYYERIIEHDIFTKSNQVVYRRRKRQELCTEGVEISRLPRFNDWICLPSHTEYKRTIEIPHEDETFRFFNSYHPLPHKPKEFQLPAGFIKDPAGFDYEQIPEIRHTAAFLKHIFDYENHRNRYLTLGWDWLTLCYLEPTQRMQALCLVSSEEGTGKSTFINLILAIFGQNATKTEASRIGGNFNAMSGGKLIQCVEETKDEKGGIENKLKDLITAYEKVVEAKHQDARVVKSFDKYVFASNHEDGFMKVGTETTRFAVMKVRPIKNKVADFEEKLYLEIPYLLYFMQRRKVITPKTDRLYFDPKLWENEALLKLRHASKDQVQQVMEELLQSIWLRCEITDPVIFLSSQYLKLLMCAYGGKSYEQKTPVYFQNTATKDMRLNYRDTPTARDTVEISSIHSDAWINATSWEYQRKKAKARFIEFPIWRFCTPADVFENFTTDKANDILKYVETVGEETAAWCDGLRFYLEQDK